MKSGGRKPAAMSPQTRKIIELGRKKICWEKPGKPGKSACSKKIVKLAQGVARILTPTQQIQWRKMTRYEARLRSITGACQWRALNRKRPNCIECPVIVPSLYYACVLKAFGSRAKFNWMAYFLGVAALIKKNTLIVPKPHVRLNPFKVAKLVKGIARTLTPKQQAQWRELIFKPGIRYRRTRHAHMFRNCACDRIYIGAGPKHPAKFNWMKYFMDGAVLIKKISTTIPKP